MSYTFDLHDELQNAGKSAPGHEDLFMEPDDDYNAWCTCGKWIELGTYDLWDHIDAIITDDLSKHSAEFNDWVTWLRAEHPEAFAD
ncbi:hypothetical protein GCM10007304_17430 [Rhodococcoides trifolii]|uniref:Uncharacterized protein n=1 Tax=Rhodococcoides trifolii TaxID=908250 RepID=A0A917CZN7_9NOCA|nr:hypothetical protein [Rhodococcus trifolii]GGG03823.1 hypothetical protein GCM10007304_17430 [Rhodococcus trifolii]